MGREGCRGWGEPGIVLVCVCSEWEGVPGSWGLSRTVLWAMGAEGEGRFQLALAIRQDAEPA